LYHPNVPFPNLFSVGHLSANCHGLRLLCSHL
jgi:hypothetical protein